jgi:hypothetical protein
MRGNAGEWGVWSVCRVADVSHGTGRLADSEQSAPERSRFRCRSVSSVATQTLDP